ncbi:MAG: DUF2281 domain-containing protein [Planctomycetota bacterium]
MTVVEKIAVRLQHPPEPLQEEVLDFVRFLESKSGARSVAEEREEWLAGSLANAMRGLEDEPELYSVDDLREVFS